jgi:hypothetical protein
MRDFWLQEAITHDSSQSSLKHTAHVPVSE